MGREEGGGGVGREMDGVGCHRDSGRMEGKARGREVNGQSVSQKMSGGRKLKIGENSCEKKE